MIISIKKTRVRKIVESICTGLGWLFLLFFIYTLLTYVKPEFNYQFYVIAISNSNSIIIFTGFVFLMMFIMLISWGTYNKLRYGPLNRRAFPADTQLEEVATYFELTEEEVTKIQEERYIER
ncbi:poly-beta-1,6-N-acetyl-D-glucosamine biosynthesis protein PgaD [Bacillus alkalicellulosilyticus]|uniref:poly-beta-1,6-N-acetyl-D-glucosamine biosynthesis protein PgaD n=1 Tax=Alkalihalobacterium alkalicellulosilyticum TaxID=1912214 RepID=UPI0009977625|nr:poly-beta-1,6-N-acetyl-D-glucosamine biosynthesis protein PgaD [Bacillus alkalicellulosilyticus]